MDASPPRPTEQPRARNRRLRISLREILALATIAALGLAYVSARWQLVQLRAEVERLRLETGYLSETEEGQIAAVRVPSDEPLTYRLRVRVPDAPAFRVAYSSIFPHGAVSPYWFAAVEVPPGGSVVTVRIGEDPRDARWKITTLVRSDRGTKRVATALPEEHARVFRGSHEVWSTGIGRQTVAASVDQSIRLLDERWLVGGGGLLLYGDRPPDRDQVGVYAELQPADQPL